MTFSPKLYLDANVFITAYETTGARSDHAWWLLDSVENGDLRAVTSELTLAELLVRPLREGAADLADAYRSIIRAASSFELVAVSRDVLIAAAQLRADHRALKLPDAIHVATAVRQLCQAFVTDDRRMSLPSGMSLLELGPHTVQQAFEGRL